MTILTNSTDQQEVEYSESFIVGKSRSETRSFKDKLKKHKFAFVVDNISLNSNIFHSNLPQLIHSRACKNGVVAEILLDKDGRVLGRVLQQGHVFDARIKGLPTKINLDKINKLIEFLELNSNIKTIFDDIVVEPKLRGGLDPASIAVGAAISLSTVATMKVLDWFSPTKSIVYGPDSKPVAIHPTGPNASITVQSHNQGAINSSVTNFFTGIGKKEALIAGWVAFLAGTAYGTYYYLEDIKRNAKNSEGNTPLHLAVLKEDQEEIRKLLNDKSIVGFLKPQANVNAQNNDGDTALHLAIRKNIPEIIKILKNNGSNEYLKNNNGEIPYNLASSSSSDAVKSAMGIKLVAHANAEQKHDI